MAEGLEGGFSAVYPMLRALEEAGADPARLLRRGARCRAVRAGGRAGAAAAVREPGRRDGDAPVVHLLAAADPANPYGAALPWPRRGETGQAAVAARGRARRSFSSTVSRRCTWTAAATSLQTLPAFDDPAVADGRPRGA